MSNKYEKEIEEIVDKANNSGIPKRKLPISYYWRNFKMKYPRLLQAISLLLFILISSSFMGIEFSLVISVIILLFFYVITKYQGRQSSRQYKKKWRGKEVD